MLISFKGAYWDKFAFIDTFIMDKTGLKLAKITSREMSVYSLPLQLQIEALRTDSFGERKQVKKNKLSFHKPE